MPDRLRKFPLVGRKRIQLPKAFLPNIRKLPTHRPESWVERVGSVLAADLSLEKKPGKELFLGE